MNDKDLQKLATLLAKQLDVQNKFLDLEKRKTKVLVDGNIEKLDEILRQEQPLILTSGSLEKQREALLAEAGLLDMTLRQIMENYDPENKYLLKSKFDNLVDVLSQLKKVNNMNAKILNSRLSVIGQCLSLIGLRQENLTYNKDGLFR